MAVPGNKGEFHRADPAYRRQMEILLATVAVLGVAGVLTLHWWLSRLGGGDVDPLTYQAWLYRLLAGMCLLLGAVAAGFAQWLYRMASASALERRWPPSDMRTSADIRIRYLTSADALVMQLKGTALALAVLALSLCIWGIWLLRAG